MVRGLFYLAVVLLTVFVLSTASAAHPPSKVAVVVDTVTDTELQREVLTRLRAELVNVGFSVIERKFDPHGDLRSALERIALDENAFAAIGINSEHAATADVWVADQMTGKTLVRRLRVAQQDVDGDMSPAEVFAVRAVELLVASLLELRNAADPPATSSEPRPVSEKHVPADVQGWVAARRKPRVVSLLQPTAHLGVLAAHGLRGIGFGAGPSARLGIHARSGFGGRISFSGPILTAELNRPEGRTQIRQWTLLLEATYRARAVETPWVPLASAGLGVYHLQAEGFAETPWRGAEDSTLALQLDAGVGVDWNVCGAFGIIADMHVFVAIPHPEVRVATKPAGRAASPSVAASLSGRVHF